jgi:hypothetical protein
VTRSKGEPCPPSLRQLVRGRQPVTLAIACPRCEAPAGRPCTGPSGRTLANQHASRFEKAGEKPRFAPTPDLGEAS